MAVTTITFEAPAEVASELDQAASVQRRDRGEILQDALVQYLASDSEFRAMIEEGVRQAEASDLVEHSEIESMIAGWDESAQIS